MKEFITILVVLISYIFLTIKIAGNSRALRPQIMKKLKEEAEKNDCVTEAVCIKQKVTYDANDEFNRFPYYGGIYQYTVNGRNYRFKMYFGREETNPNKITVWYKKGHPGKRFLSVNDPISKVMWIIYILPIILGILTYQILKFLGF